MCEFLRNKNFIRQYIDILTNLHGYFLPSFRQFQSFYLFAIFSRIIYPCCSINGFLSIYGKYKAAKKCTRCTQHAKLNETPKTRCYLTEKANFRSVIMFLQTSKCIKIQRSIPCTLNSTSSRILPRYKPLSRQTEAAVST